MVNLNIGLIVAALAAAFFGFGGIATDFAETARLLFLVFLALLSISSLLTFVGARSPDIGREARHVVR